MISPGRISGFFRAWLISVVSGLALATAPALGAPPQQLETWAGCLMTADGGVPVSLEHATTNSQRQWGLMERLTLPENSGMLFVYDAQRPGSAGFWMYRTRLELDIAWLDENGVIVATDTMTPCESDQARDCPTWQPGVPHQHVLEMNAGFFKKHHVRVGDTLVVNLNDDKACPMAP